MARRIIGLTGGIATGKSSVAAYLESKYKLPILDADIYARDAVQPGSVALANITQRYGPEMLLADGTLDRKQLGNIVFNDESERAWLEGQIHPYVRKRILSAQRQLTDPIVVAVVPLLFEAKMTDLASEIWVVVCDDEQQCQRLMRRDSISRSQAEARIASQMPLIEKANQANLVINNDGNLTDLYDQINREINQ
ncbi:dephospho-CoA kinase [Acaryochloris sp. CCMEE 5410]|uniref:dephospho-CoA kinase n=1 Tax=Acaryochloris sp. CCMEE 5410 TaxID=310037 RepID=UPI0002484DBA|nr:dephospho-CoA kinase [Acaryochloris sp. CCMEE 5410]KAI9134498.1 dephospho-CoA kinase [Acaryochloris sp. CCMEE 5410]